MAQPAKPLRADAARNRGTYRRATYMREITAQFDLLEVEHRSAHQPGGRRAKRDHLSTVANTPRVAAAWTKAKGASATDADITVSGSMAERGM